MTYWGLENYQASYELYQNLEVLSARPRLEI